MAGYGGVLPANETGFSPGQSSTGAPQMPFPALKVVRRPGGDERVIVLVHGMWSRPHVWENFRRYFEARGYRVVTPTLRHHNIEPGGEHHPELGSLSLLHYAEDLAAEIRALDTRPFIIGHSMGGLLALMLAARGLARGAALLASSHCAPIFAFDISIASVFRREFMSRFWRRPQLPSYAAMRSGVLNGLGEEEARALYATLIPESGRCLAEIGFWFFDRQQAAYVDAKQVACPLLFLTGTEDRLTTPSHAWATAEYFGPKARIEFLRGRGHWLPGEPGWETAASKVERFFEIEAPLFRIETDAAEAVPSGLIARTA